MPCRRMHCATFTICVSACDEGCVCVPGVRPPIGISFWHFACVASNTGDEGSTPASFLNWNPPPGSGSGKLGTPWARMHLAYASA